MDDALAARLLESIESDRLTILCGAGLSMAAPSAIPPAKEIANKSAEKYHTITGDTALESIRTDIEAIATFFYDRGTFTSTFTNQLIPWGDFRVKPNCGHQTIADFLICNVFDFGFTTNLDTLIEDAARELGEKDFQAAIDGSEANTVRRHKTLLKIHGCHHRDRKNTLWCRSQLDSNPLQSRIQSSKQWLIGHLLERDLLILGFCTDWDYLNSVLAGCISQTEPNLVVLIDPQDDRTLQRKAPELWDWANSGHFQFHHEPESGHLFLDELRKRYSVRFLNRLLSNSMPTYNNILAPIPISVSRGAYSHLTSEYLYSLRRDCCGVTSLDAVCEKRPTKTMEMLGAIILVLISNGAISEGPFHILNGTKFRVINAAGKLMSQVKQTFANEPPPPTTADIVICVGAYDDGGVPIDVVRGAGTGTVVRAGLAGDWLDTEEGLDRINR